MLPLCFPQCSSSRSLWMLLPSRQGLAYQPQLHEVSLCLWETLALEITYVVDVITHCHCVRIVVILWARYYIGTIHSYGNLLNLESPSDGLLRYCLPPNEGTRLSGRRIVANFLSATSRTVLTIYVSFLLHRYLLDVTLPFVGTSPYTRSCHCCCPVVNSYSNTWNLLAGLCTDYAVVLWATRAYIFNLVSISICSLYFTWSADVTCLVNQKYFFV